MVSVPKMGTFILVLGMFGCASIQPAPPLCPLRPELASITVEEQRLMAPATVTKLSDNQLKLKSHIEILEAELRCST